MSASTTALSEIPRGERRPEGPGARTLFERLQQFNTMSCMATVDTGALDKISIEVGMVIGEFKRNFAEKTTLVRLRRRAQMEQELNRRRRWLQEHRDLSASFLGSLLFDFSIDFGQLCKLDSVVLFRCKHVCLGNHSTVYLMKHVDKNTKPPSPNCPSPVYNFLLFVAFPD